MLAVDVAVPSQSCGRQAEVEFKTLWERLSRLSEGEGSLTRGFKRGAEVYSGYLPLCISM